MKHPPISPTNTQDALPKNHSFSLMEVRRHIVVSVALVVWIKRAKNHTQRRMYPFNLQNPSADISQLSDSKAQSYPNELPDTSEMTSLAGIHAGVAALPARRDANPAPDTSGTTIPPHFRAASNRVAYDNPKRSRRTITPLARQRLRYLYAGSPRFDNVNQDPGHCPARRRSVDCAKPR